jgi:hypothetical protein
MVVGWQRVFEARQIPCKPHVAEQASPFQEKYGWRRRGVSLYTKRLHQNHTSTE